MTVNCSIIQYYEQFFCNIQKRLDKSSPKLDNLFYTTLQSNKGELYENNKAYFVLNVQHNQASS